MEMLMQLWKTEFELVGISSGSIEDWLVMPTFPVIDYEKKVIQQLCAKQYVAWKWDLSCKERKRGGTSVSRDENGQVDVWR